MKILVTGGAGYIGSFMVHRLISDGYQVLIIDNLQRGHKEFLNPRAEFFNGSLQDRAFLSTVIKNKAIDAVIHFAAFISMGESMENPFLYFENNLYGSLCLLETLIENNVRDIIFSSTAGVYGNPVQIPIPETHQTKPENPYGESKLMIEKILSWYYTIHSLHSVSLRYFNASGAAMDGKNGEKHVPETHIIPNIIASILEKKEFQLFGTDYHTPDGTCVRDYIHVLDLVDAHVKALLYLKKNPGKYVFNVGTGKGYSNREVLAMVKKVSNQDLVVKELPRRPGDADSLIADVSAINTSLQFTPRYSDLETIVTSAWKWHHMHHEK